MKRLLHFKLKLLAALVVLVALIKGVAFAAAIWAESHIPWLEQTASGLLGMQVRVAHVSTSWLSLTPGLRLRSLRLGDGQQLDLGDVDVSLSVAGLSDWPDAVPLKIRLRGTSIHLVREADGSLAVMGLPGIGGTGSGKVMLPSLIHVIGAELIWEDRQQGLPPLKLEKLDVRLKSTPGNLQASIIDAEDHLYLRADVKGQPNTPEFSAKLYLETRGLPLAPWLQPYWPDLGLSQLALNLEAWADWQHNAMQSIQVELHQAEVDWNADGQAVSANLAARLLAMPDGLGWHAQMQQAQIQGQGLDFQPGVLDLRWQAPRLRLALDHISLAGLIKLASHRPEWRDMLAALAPRGEVSALNLDWGAESDWHLSLNLANYSQEAWQDWPGVSNISTGVAISPGSIVLDLDSKASSIDLRPLFRDPITLDQLQGAVEVNFGEHGWSVRGADLVAANEDIHTQSQVLIKADDGQPLFLDLASEFYGFGGHHAGRYYPVGIMEPALVDWLDRSIKQGKVPSGRFVLKGPAQDFPFHKTNNGLFEVDFRAEDAILDYFPGWPVITKAVAHVLFHNNSLTIDADSARLLDSNIRQARVQIENLFPVSPLKISGVAEGDLTNLMRILTDSPLKQEYGSFTKGLVASGPAAIDTQLTVPLDDGQKYEFAAKVQMKGSKLKLPDYQLQLDKLRGTLALGASGLRGQDIKAKALGTDILLGIQTTDDGGQKVQVAGKFGVDGLRQQFPWLVGFPASGQAQAEVEIDLPPWGTSGAAQLAIQSDLVGLALDLPKPIGKSAEEMRKFEVELPLQAESSKLDLLLDDGLELNVRQLPSGGLRVQAAMPSLPLGDWIERWASLSLPASANDLSTQELRLRVGHLQNGLLQTSQLELNAKREAQAWVGIIESEQLSGKFSWPLDPAVGALQIQLAKLALTSSDDIPAEASSSKPKPVGSNTPTDTPLLDISCEKLMLDDALLGKLVIHSRRSGVAQEFDQISLSGGELKLSANGLWQQPTEGQVSSVQGKLESEDLAHIAALTGGAKIHAADTAIGFDLNWPNQPWAFTKTLLSGKVDVITGQGILTEVRPGFGRLLGLINFQSLGRRLRLDFSDVTHQGFAFDRIEGNLSLENGMVFTNNLNISAPAAEVGIAGNLSLELKLMDLLISVSPKLDTALPVAGAVVGGPVTGVAVLLAQQLMSSKLNTSPAFRYSAKGSWEDPEIEEIVGDNTRKPLVVE